MIVRIRSHFAREGFGLLAVKVPDVAPFIGYCGLQRPAFMPGVVDTHVAVVFGPAGDGRPRSAGVDVPLSRNGQTPFVNRVMNRPLFWSVNHASPRSGKSRTRADV